MTDKKSGFLRERLRKLVPVVDNLRRLGAAARHAFNRNSLTELEEMTRLQDLITLDLDDFFLEVEELQAKAVGEVDPEVQRLHAILTHLEHIGALLKQLEGPIRRKICENLIINDRDFFHLNDLFICLKGMFRGLSDLFHTENPVLARYLTNKVQEMRAGCFAAETAHETTMTMSFGQPHAFAVYLEMINILAQVLDRLGQIVRLLPGSEAGS